MPIADPPLLQSLLLEGPWPLVLTLVGTAAVLRLLAARRRQRRLDVAALIALLLALGVYLLASIVTTNREQLLERTEQLVMATAPLDSPTIEIL